MGSSRCDLERARREAIRDLELRPGFNIVWTPDDEGIGTVLERLCFVGFCAIA